MAHNQRQGCARSRSRIDNEFGLCGAIVKILESMTRKDTEAYIRLAFSVIQTHYLQIAFSSLKNISKETYHSTL